MTSIFMLLKGGEKYKFKAKEWAFSNGYVIFYNEDLDYPDSVVATVPDSEIRLIARVEDDKSEQHSKDKKE